MTKNAPMQHRDFRVGEPFWSDGHRWRCTDIGTRVIAAIKLDHDDDPSWYNGLPYAVAEVVMAAYGPIAAAVLHVHSDGLLRRDDYRQIAYARIDRPIWPTDGSRKTRSSFLKKRTKKLSFAVPGLSGEVRPNV